MDWCRGRIFINDLLAFPRVWTELQRHPDVAFIYNARNRFINPPPPGVRDWSIEFAVFVNGKVPPGGGCKTHQDRSPTEKATEKYTEWHCFGDPQVT